MTPQRAARDSNPPRWAETLLRILLPSRDRDSVTGDLLEEYREVVLPARGRLRAQLWYLRHALSLIDGAVLGAVLGTIFGMWNMVATRLDPLADDTAVALLLFYGPMFTAWGAAGFVAARRNGRIIEAIKVGATVGFVTFVVFSVANLVRVNLFLETVRHRADWQGLIVRYQASGFESFRAFANYDYVTGAPLTLFVPSVIGAMTGLIGGLFAIVGRHQPRGLPQ
jgi:hypothetical protein